MKPFRIAIISTIVFFIPAVIEFFYWENSHAQILAFLLEDIILAVLKVIIFIVFLVATFLSYKYVSKIKFLFLCLVGLLLFDLLRGPLQSYIYDGIEFIQDSYQQSVQSEEIEKDKITESLLKQAGQEKIVSDFGLYPGLILSEDQRSGTIQDVSYAEVRDWYEAQFSTLGYTFHREDAASTTTIESTGEVRSLFVSYFYISAKEFKCTLKVSEHKDPQSGLKYVKVSLE